MKKRVVLLLLVTSIVGIVIGCKSITESTDEKGAEKVEERTENPARPEQEEEKIVAGEQEPTQTEPEAIQTTTIRVYFSNADATGFAQEDIIIESLSPEEVLSALVSKGGMSSEVMVNKFTVTKVDGKETIEMDVNGVFSTYLKTMGSTGEYYIIGGLCNTFLDAYDCEQIKITVEGHDLDTGHAEYPGYLMMFE